MGGGVSKFQSMIRSERGRLKTIREYSDKFRNQTFESIVAINEDGDIIGDPLDGEESRVGSDEFDKIANGHTVVHNHPLDGTFTPSDVYKLVSLSLKQLYAVGPTMTYSLRPMYLKYQSQARRMKFYQAYDAIESKLLNEAEKEFAEKAKGNMSMWKNYKEGIKEIWEHKCHVWLMKNANKYGFEYSARKVKGRK